MPAAKGSTHKVGLVSPTHGHTAPVKFWYDERTTTSLTLFSCDGGEIWASDLEVAFRFTSWKGRLRLAAENVSVDGQSLRLLTGFGYESTDAKAEPESVGQPTTQTGAKTEA